MEYFCPTDLATALAHLKDGKATVLAGGTDLLLQARAGRREYGQRLVNVCRLPELRKIEISKGVVTIGALTTHTDILGSDELNAVAPVLRMTANAFASAQIRNAGTLGGNLCNASPAGDMAIPLLLLDAQVILVRLKAGREERRELPLDQFLLGPGRSALLPGELLEAVTFPMPSEGTRASFRKSGPRPALEISIVSVGAMATIKEDTWTNVRIAIGAVAPTAIRAYEAETLLQAGAVDEARITAAQDAALAVCAPIDDVRASAWYRRHLAGVFIGDVLDDLRS